MSFSVLRNRTMKVTLTKTHTKYLKFRSVVVNSGTPKCEIFPIALIDNKFVQDDKFGNTIRKKKLNFLHGTFVLIAEDDGRIIIANNATNHQVAQRETTMVASRTGRCKISARNNQHSFDVRTGCAPIKIALDVHTLHTENL